MVKSAIKEMLIWFVWYPFRIIIRLLPFRIIYVLSVLGGNILYFISKEKRMLMIDELHLVFPDKASAWLRGISRRSFINYVISEIEVLLYPFMDKEYIQSSVRVDGIGNLDKALLSGRGVLLFQAHFGAFQMVMPVVGYCGYKMNQVSALASEWKKEIHSPMLKKVSSLKAKHERSLPVRHIPMNSTLRSVFECLKKNEIVGLTIDGGGGFQKKRVETVKFLGRAANIHRGAVDIAIRTGAEIVPAFILSEKNLKHRLIFHEPIHVAETMDKDEKARRILTVFIRTLERYIYRWPTHYGYTLYHRRFRVSKDPYPLFLDQTNMGSL